ncbi:NUDIX hydrolase [Nocardiopsis halophila]|uniref:NUDIX hydrolase n=1 Tax=Nocardiopsis halophila TaxID=141692 RepID=UPI00034C648C|nr:NUDIX hydrolase [Nocardiopsis halophila]
MADDYPFDEAEITSAWPPRDTAPGGYMEPIRAAGAVLWRQGESGREAVLVHRPDRDDWTLPKGKVKNGEHLVTAAAREVAEETGLRPVLGRRLPPQRYLRGGWPKLVDWWAAEAGPGASEFTPNEEIDRVEWVPLAEARDRLTYDHDVSVLDNFVSGPLETFPLVLLRHAPAGEKRAWEGDDLLRPLDETGRETAGELARVLEPYGPMRVVSSAAARCTETVLPYSAATGAEVRTVPALTAGVHPGGGVDTAAARRAFATLVEEGRPTLVCIHGELVADLMKEALARLGAPVTQQISLRKGTFWVLHITSGQERSLAAVERHEATR